MSEEIGPGRRRRRNHASMTVLFPHTPRFHIIIPLFLFSREESGLRAGYFPPPFYHMAATDAVIQFSFLLLFCPLPAFFPLKFSSWIRPEIFPLLR